MKFIYKTSIFLAIVFFGINMTNVNAQINSESNNDFTISEGPIVLPPTSNSTYLDVPSSWNNMKSSKSANSKGIKTAKKYIKELEGYLIVEFDENGIRKINIPNGKKYSKDLLSSSRLVQTRDIGNCPSPRECLFETQTETATVLCVVYSPMCHLISLFY